MTFRYDADTRHLVVTLFDVERRLPVAEVQIEDVDTNPWVSKLRRVRIDFENRWSLSILWGTSTYSDNHMAGWGDGPEFTETPIAVEVGVLTPDDGLWGDPLPYIQADGMFVLLRVLDQLPSHPGPLDDDEVDDLATFLVAAHRRFGIDLGAIITTTLGRNN